MKQASGLAAGKTLFAPKLMNLEEAGKLHAPLILPTKQQRPRQTETSLPTSRHYAKETLPPRAIVQENRFFHSLSA